MMISINKCEAISNFRRLHDVLERLERIHNIEGGNLEVDATVEDRRVGNPCGCRLRRRLRHLQE